MNFVSPRTDLALEARTLRATELSDSEELPGVSVCESDISGFKVTTVSVLDDVGANSLCKPIGKYITIETDRLISREENAFAQCAELLAGQLKTLLGRALGPDARILVIGLGNEAITPDAIGPWTLEHLLVTRHLKERQLPDFAHFSAVSALRAGVLGTTGIESALLVQIVSAAVKPDVVIAVDALASCQLSRLCRTVQLTDTGITPGSGVGNSRAELSEKTLSVPVIAIGVPTVVDASTLAADLVQNAGISITPDKLPATGMIVTPRDIDRSARDAAKLVGYGLNLAFHDGLTLEDIDMLLS